MDEDEPILNSDEYNSGKNEFIGEEEEEQEQEQEQEQENEDNENIPFDEYREMRKGDIKNHWRFLDISKKVIQMILTRGYTTLFDSFNLNLVKPHVWHTSGQDPHAKDIFYASGNVKDHETGEYHTVRMHRLFLGLKKENIDLKGDHINGHTLNNTMINIRSETDLGNGNNRKMNNNNKTGCVGICDEVGFKRYRFQWTVKGKRHRKCFSYWTRESEKQIVFKEAETFKEKTYEELGKTNGTRHKDYNKITNVPDAPESLQKSKTCTEYHSIFDHVLKDGSNQIESVWFKGDKRMGKKFKHSQETGVWTRTREDAIEEALEHQKNILLNPENSLDPPGRRVKKQKVSKHKNVSDDDDDEISI